MARMLSAKAASTPTEATTGDAVSSRTARPAEAEGRDSADPSG